MNEDNDRRPTAEQTIRMAALIAAAEIAPSGLGIARLTDTASILAAWITTGQLPRPEPGTYY
jgi:hypothetical protein